MTACSFTACAASAISEFRVLPRRTDAPPISDGIRRALAWPNVESPVTVASCALHREAFRKAARTVMGETVIAGDVVTREVGS